MTKEMFNHFTNVSLAALIISCGFILENTYDHWVHGLSFNIRASFEELTLLQNRLAELGIASKLASSSNRYDRAVKRLVIPYSEFPNVKALVGDVIFNVPSKINLLDI